MKSGSQATRHGWPVDRYQELRRDPQHRHPQQRWQGSRSPVETTSSARPISTMKTGSWLARTISRNLSTTHLTDQCRSCVKTRRGLAARQTYSSRARALGARRSPLSPTNARTRTTAAPSSARTSWRTMVVTWRRVAKSIQGCSNE